MITIKFKQADVCIDNFSVFEKISISRLQLGQAYLVKGNLLIELTKLELMQMNSDMSRKVYNELKQIDQVIDQLGGQLYNWSVEADIILNSKKD